MNRRRLSRLAAALGLWGGIALLYAGQLAAAGLGFATALRRAAIEWALWAALWPLVRLFARGFRLVGERAAASLPVHMILSGTLAVAQLALFALIDRGGAPATASFWETFRAEALRRTFLGVMTYFAMVAVATALDYRLGAARLE